MHILMVGLNHTTAPIALREKLAIQDEELDTVLRQLRETRTILESVVLSTCNRTEIYAIVSSIHAGQDFFGKFLARRAAIDATEMRTYLYSYVGKEVVTHLMKVASGLDSLVIGETQILGQVRGAFQSSLEADNIGILLNQLFKRALQVGKRAQSDTTIGQNPVSVSYAAVQLAKKIFGSFANKRALILGAGKMSKLSAQHLYANGIEQLFIANRTFERASSLASQFNGQAVPWASVPDVLSKVDIVISSTGAIQPVVTKEMVALASSRHKKHPLVLIDIALPRDIEPGAAKQANVYLYDIDDLRGVVAANIAERERQAKQVEVMIDEAIADYSHWLTEQEIVPVIAAIREKGNAIQASVMESLCNKLPDMDERTRKLVHKHTMSIVNQILRDPIQNMKELATASGGARHVQVFAELFGISPDALSNMQNIDVFGLENKLANDGVSFAERVMLWRDAKDEQSIWSDAALHPVLR